MNEDFKYVKLIRKLIFKKLSYFEKLFSKRKSIYITLLRLKQDVILKFTSDFLAFGLFKYKTFLKYPFLKKKYIKELFV